VEDGILYMMTMAGGGRYWCIMVWAFAEMLDPNMLFNWDATQFSLSREGDKEVVYILSKDYV
jgi:hypothetical protein